MICSQPRIPMRVLAPFIAFSVGMGGLALVANQPENNYQPERVVTSQHQFIKADPVALTFDSPTITTSPGHQSHVTEDGPTVQAWTGQAEDQVTEPVETPFVEPSPTAATTDTERCEEDMPCWDCETMGNRVCGPIDDSESAWTVWDEVGASRGMAGDGFRVDYMASTPDYPENLTAGDIPLQGRDGTWYVFHVTIGGDEGTGNIEEPADMS